MEEYVCALTKEMSRHANTHVKTVYLGGGTPSLLTDDLLARLVGQVRSTFSVAPDAEWTMEANPESVSPERAGVFKALGFTRVSLGAQSFSGAYLKFLGRNHDAGQARAAFAALRNAGFTNINIDMMYGFPGQTRNELEEDLKAVTDLAGEHVSIYTLTIEPNSRFYARQMVLDNNEKLADDYMRVTEYLERSGLMQYEVSNFARPGFESRHNMVYWQGNDYLGLGMGAHSLLDRTRSWNKSQLIPYLMDIAAVGSAVDGSETLDSQTRLRERLIFGLRMNAGVDLSRLESMSGLAIPDDRRKILSELTDAGFLTMRHGRVAATPKGRLVLDMIAEKLI